jgi:RNA polymerase sigma-70 factor, ECF subfamily
MESDSDLMNRCAGGDVHAMRELIERYEPSLRRFLHRLLADPEDVEDTLCDVFVRVWRTAPRYRGDCSVGTWMRRVAVSAATDALRRRRKTRQLYTPMLDDSMPAPPSDEPERTVLALMDSARSVALVRAAMETLKPEERVVVTLHYLEGHPYAEIAALLGVPVTTVRMRLWSARRRMRRYMEKRLEDETS